MPSYLKIAWRSFKRDRHFTLLNLFGLVVGLTCTLLIWLWVHDERSVDKFHKNDARLYQVLANFDDGKSVFTNDETPGLLASSLAAEFPEIAYSTPVVLSTRFDEPGIVSLGNKHLKAAAQFAGSDFFSVFSFPIQNGDQKSFADIHSVFITKGLSESLFGNTDCIGKTVSWSQKGFNGSYTIGGVIESPPANSTLKFDILFPYELYLQANQKLLSWGNNDPSTFLVLKKGVDVAAFNKKFAGFIRTKKEDSKANLFLQQFSDRYLHNHYENGSPAGGRIEYVRLFSIIAIFILVIACINFMNLATARASRRMKETGMKKLLGASRAGLIGQQLSESLLLSFAALGVATLAVLFLLPVFNAIVDKQIVFRPTIDTIIAGVTIALLTGLIAGSYPAFYLSKFNPVAVLKGKWVSGVSETWVRKGLVLFQFALSAIFIVAVLVVYKQMQFIQTKNLGYHRDNIIYFDKGTNSSAPQDKAAFESGMLSYIDEIKKIPGVKNAANFRHNVVNRNGGTSDLSWEGKEPGTEINFTDIAAGYGFVETLGIEMKEGRSFMANYPSEKSKIVFNETAIKAMGLKEPLGKTVHLWGENRQIIGVMKDFNFQSLHENLKPCFLDLMMNERAPKIMVKIEAGREKETIQRLSAFYQRYQPGFAFDFRFLDADYQALYASENRVANLSKYFAGMAILISSLGLFGLATFTAQKRKREMGIRKVIGASSKQIAFLLGKDYLKPIGFAMLIAFPIAWMMMSQWLNGFEYRIRLDPVLFVIAAATLLFISLITVAFQSLKTATADPVETLRTGF